jgi:CRP-like cAMP-binding protein
MDEWSLALLSCKLNLIGVEPGGIIKRRGDKSEYAYILLGGAAKVRIVLCAFSGCFWSFLALASQLGSGARVALAYVLISCRALANMRPL